jgi:ribonuclease HI
MSLIIESIAAWRAVILCEELGLQSVEFEGDSMVVVNALNSNTPYWRACGSIVEDTRDRLLQFLTWSVQHARREANQVAHFLAKHALSVNQDVVWKEECPSFIQDIIYAE